MSKFEELLKEYGMDSVEFIIRSMIHESKQNIETQKKEIEEQKEYIERLDAPEDSKAQHALDLYENNLFEETIKLYAFQGFLRDWLDYNLTG